MHLSAMKSKAAVQTQTLLSGAPALKSEERFKCQSNASTSDLALVYDFICRHVVAVLNIGELFTTLGAWLSCLTC